MIPFRKIDLTIGPPQQWGAVVPATPKQDRRTPYKWNVKGTVDPSEFDLLDRIGDCSGDMVRAMITGVGAAADVHQHGNQAQWKLTDLGTYPWGISNGEQDFSHDAIKCKSLTITVTSTKQSDDSWGAKVDCSWNLQAELDVGQHAALEAYWKADCIRVGTAAQPGLFPEPSPAKPTEASSTTPSEVKPEDLSPREQSQLAAVNAGATNAAEVQGAIGAEWTQAGGAKRAIQRGLSRLEDLGLVSSNDVGTGHTKSYAITIAGAAAARQLTTGAKDASQAS